MTDQGAAGSPGSAMATYFCLTCRKMIDGGAVRESLTEPGQFEHQVSVARKCTNCPPKLVNHPLVRRGV